MYHTAQQTNQPKHSEIYVRFLYQFYINKIETRDCYLEIFYNNLSHF